MVLDRVRAVMKVMMRTEGVVRLWIWRIGGKGESSKRRRGGRRRKKEVSSTLTDERAWRSLKILSKCLEGRSRIEGLLLPRRVSV